MKDSDGWKADLGWVMVEVPHGFGSKKKLAVTVRPTSVGHGANGKAEEFGQLGNRVLSE